jgi:hypothetical protein
MRKTVGCLPVLLLILLALACTSARPIDVLILPPTEFTDYRYLEPVITALPYAGDFPFALQNNEILYSMSETLGKPCYYLIEGSILDLNGESYPDAVVVLEMLDDFPEQTIGYANMYESGGWGTILPASSVAYEVWLQTSMDGEQLSPKIYVPTRGCDNNLATLTFVQVQE